MAKNSPLLEFIGANRDELIGRCRVKVGKRSSPPPTEGEIDHGVPLFLDQLSEVLRDDRGTSHEISKSAAQHGHELMIRGFTVSQVVHDYGDVCQSVTDLAVETNAPISSGDFGTLNRCLDDAIAGAVTAYASAQDGIPDGPSNELRRLAHSAMTGFESLQAGNVGVGGSTGALVHRTLKALCALVDRPSV
jgi:hypothetical protein